MSNDLKLAQVAVSHDLNEIQQLVGQLSIQLRKAVMNKVLDNNAVDIQSILNKLSRSLVAISIEAKAIDQHRNAKFSTVNENLASLQVYNPPEVVNTIEEIKGKLKAYKNSVMVYNGLLLNSMDKVA